MSTAVKTEPTDEPLVDTNKISKAASAAMTNMVASRVTEAKNTAEEWGFGNLFKAIASWIKTNFGFSLPGLDDTSSQANTTTPSTPATTPSNQAAAQAAAQEAAANNQAGKATLVNAAAETPSPTPGASSPAAGKKAGK